MIKKIKIGEKMFEVEIEEIRENLLKIRLDGKEFFFSLTNSEPKLIKKEELEKLFVSEIFLEKTKIGLKEKEIRSPLPGEIAKIFVKEGEEIEVNQKLLVIVSMKMENEILAPTSGKIKEIKVKDGQVVQKDDVLIILE